jgi:hypothetical protein
MSALSHCINCGESFIDGFGCACSLACLHEHQNHIALAQFQLGNPDINPPPRSALGPVVQELIDYTPHLLSIVHPDRNGNSEASNRITQILLVLRDTLRKAS